MIDFNTPIIIAEADFKAIKPFHACYLSMEVTIYSGVKLITQLRTERIGRKNFSTSLQERDLWEILLLESCSAESRCILLPKALDSQITIIYNLEKSLLFLKSETTLKIIIKTKSRNNIPSYFTLACLARLLLLQGSCLVFMWIILLSCSNSVAAEII